MSKDICKDCGGLGKVDYLYSAAVDDSRAVLELCRRCRGSGLHRDFTAEELVREIDFGLRRVDAVLFSVDETAKGIAAISRALARKFGDAA